MVDLSNQRQETITFYSKNAANNNRDNPLFIIPPIENAKSMRIERVELMFSFFIIDNTNNQIVLQTTAGSTTAGHYLLTLKPGSYTDTTLILELESALSVSRRGGTTVTNISSFFDCWIDTTNSSLTFYSATETFNIYFPTSNSAAWFTGTGTALNGVSQAELFGFVDQTNYTSVAASSGSPLYGNDEAVYTTGRFISSPVAVLLSGEGDLKLHSSLASAFDYGSYRSDADIGADVLTDVSVNNNYKGMISDDIMKNREFRLNGSRITSVSFYLTLANRTNCNPTGTETNYLQLLGHPFTVKITFIGDLETVSDRVLDDKGNNLLVATSQTVPTRAPSRQQTRSGGIRKKGQGPPRNSSYPYFPKFKQSPANGDGVFIKRK